jgi:hypothetical protein
MGSNGNVSDATLVNADSIEATVALPGSLKGDLYVIQVTITQEPARGDAVAPLASGATSFTQHTDAAPCVVVATHVEGTPSFVRDRPVVAVAQSILTWTTTMPPQADGPPIAQRLVPDATWVAVDYPS